MKKTLRLTLLAVAAAALLTSCDAMLENLFPDQTGQSTGTDNTVVFNIKGADNTAGAGAWADYLGNNATNAAATIYVVLYDSVTGTILSTNSTAFTNQGPGPVNRTATTTINNVPDGSYYFDVYYDLDGDTYSDVEYTDYFGTYFQWADTSGNYNLFVSGGTTATEEVQLKEY